MKDISLQDLYKLLEKMNNDSDYSDKDIKVIEELISLKERLVEDTSATGGPAGAAGSSSVGVGGGGVALGNASIAGMGGVVSSQPSAFPGSLNGTNWISGGGKSGSGDVSVPYNPSGANRVFHKVPLGKKRNSDPNVITKKSRYKGLDMKTLRDTLKSKKSSGKIMNFTDFEKKDITTKVTKVKEGRAYDVAKKGKKETHDISKFQGIIESHIASLGAKIKQVGNDFEIHYGGEHIAQVMFREDYIGVKKEGNKFPKEFEYTELGKIKSEITDLIKKATKLNKEFGRGWIEKF
jgi:hypothetical protein